MCFPRALIDVIGDTLMKEYATPKDAAAAKPADLPTTPTICWNPGGASESEIIDPGRQAFFHFASPKVTKAFTFDQLFFRRDTYTIQFLYEYEQEGTGRQTVKEDRPVEFRPALLAPLLGATAALTTWIAELISGLVLVIILSQTDAQQLPVTVTINDFWGGAFLGLIAYKLSDWLDEKFFSQVSKQPHSGEGAGRDKRDELPGLERDRRHVSTV